MKLKYAFSAALMTLALASCGEPKDPTPVVYDDDTVVDVYFFSDFNHNDKENPYKYVATYNGNKLGKPKNPDCPDPAFPTFLGWSTYAIVDDASKLWNFEKDVVKTDSYVLCLYGIWVSE